MSPRRLIKGYTINLLVLCFNHSAITKWVHWLPMLLPMMLPGYQHWWYKLPNFGWHYHSWKRSEPTCHIAISNNGISVEILYISSKTIQRVDGSETFFHQVWPCNSGGSLASSLYSDGMPVVNIVDEKYSVWPMAHDMITRYYQYFDICYRSIYLVMVDWSVHTFIFQTQFSK